MKQIDLTPIYKAAAKVMAENSIEEIRLRLLKDDDGPSAIDFEINGTGYMSNFEEYIPTIKAVESGMMKLVISRPDNAEHLRASRNPRQPEAGGDCCYEKMVFNNSNGNINTQYKPSLVFLAVVIDTPAQANIIPTIINLSLGVLSLLSPMELINMSIHSQTIAAHIKLKKAQKPPTKTFIFPPY